MNNKIHFYENLISKNTENKNIENIIKTNNYHCSTNIYTPFLQNFINKNKIKTIVDFGCGYLTENSIYENLNIEYTGYDNCMLDLIKNTVKYHTPKYTFIVLDFYTNKESIKKADMCILKNILEYWSLNQIYNFLDYLVYNKIYKYILICNSYNTLIDYRDITEDTREDSPLQLSCNFLPLKKYNPEKIFKFNYNELSVIKT
uniref:Methyltransferase domain-containing protein n=1 Tax=viral metagenome TaxID=1070528 RepID=A0A6C0ERG9_9ZZZZ